MKELTDKIAELSKSFNRNAMLRVDGNKAAGLRARKESLELEKLLKQFRKESVKA